ncbi:MAG: signal peptidase I [Coriobacteriia bacterium]
MRKRRFRWLGYGVTALVVVAVLAALLIIVSPLAAGRDPARPSFVGGYAPIVVLGGSMEPTYHVGSILFVEDVDPAGIAVGDIITFDTPVRDGEPPSLTTHRVTAVDLANGSRAFRTQGDANNTEDSWVVPAGTVVGRGSFSIRYLGYVSSFTRSKTGFVSLVVLPAALIVLLELSSIAKSVRERRAAAILPAEETP